MSNVNIRIKEICKEKGITLEMLANRLGIIRTSLAQAMSRNSFSTTKLDEIAKILDVPVWQLFVSPKEAGGYLETHQTNDPVITCPHCGKPINLKIERP